MYSSAERRCSITMIRSFLIRVDGILANLGRSVVLGYTVGIEG
jgi:hypothetical protein